MLVVGTIVGVNAASDPLLDIAGVAPFGLALIATRVLAPGRDSTRAMWSGLATLAVIGVTWAITAVVMSALSVAREPGLHTTRVVVGHENLHNFTLWWKSIATLGNGNYFGHALSPATVLAFVCAVISHRRGDFDPLAELAATAPALAAARRSAVASSLTPLRPQGPRSTCSGARRRSCSRSRSCSAHIPSTSIPARYLVGLLYAAAAVVPAAAAGRVSTRAIVLAGTCVFALGAVVSIARQRSGASAEGQHRGDDPRGRARSSGSPRAIT